ncbi:hypothetical protein SLNWT_5755 [Streptomyces albus]|uniref:Uncharacterized protein n=1 Tax=Streptomyces albus (strain ATCC 21838 / DSM 41398 / FERM P-419 / JCM 4703 / NBRC 107858) TaxID=1081613 RepID=A0A0B5F5F5_STRA4|nr:hypothetical protein SLNWT_5755 [Streptomyces albus]AOU80432.1 hypothetical protein SLNHY_5741 [Streptomyces albus]AYN36142.1 hypothetical protein DUI70_5649 [Streptomyces albus]
MGPNGTSGAWGPDAGSGSPRSRDGSTPLPYAADEPPAGPWSQAGGGPTMFPGPGCPGPGVA